MKKLMLLTLTLAVCFVARALPVTTNATATMIVPPVINFGVAAQQIAERTATNAVTVGEYRRQKGVIIVAANSGTTMTNMTVTTTVTSGGTFYATNSLTGFVVTNVIAAVTNTVVAVSDITVPLTGLTAVDGSVYWLRVPPTRNPVLVQARIVSPGAVVTVTDSAGGVTQFATDYAYQRFTGGKALFARADSTNGVGATVSVIEE